MLKVGYVSERKRRARRFYDTNLALDGFEEPERLRNRPGRRLVGFGGPFTRTPEARVALFLPVPTSTSRRPGHASHSKRMRKRGG
jgi:hypothetical protein